VDAGGGRRCFDYQSSPVCEVLVGRGGRRWRAAEAYWLVAVSAGIGLVFESQWSCSSRPFLMRFEDSSSGVHHLRVGWLSFLCIRSRGGLLCRSLVLHLLFLVVLVVVLVSVTTLFYLNTKRVMCDFEKKQSIGTKHRTAASPLITCSDHMLQILLRLPYKHRTCATLP
jgi:hypothetical protein